MRKATFQKFAILRAGHRMDSQKERLTHIQLYNARSKYVSGKDVLRNAFNQSCQPSNLSYSLCTKPSWILWMNQNINEPISLLFDFLQVPVVYNGDLTIS